MSLFADETIEYVKKSKIKLFVLINKTIKVTGYKINLENHFNPIKKQLETAMFLIDIFHLGIKILHNYC